MAVSNPLDYFKIDISPEVAKPPMKPGVVTLRRIERVKGIFMITFAWVDMLGVTHERAFERGDFFTDFSKVLKVMTDTGLPIDADKVEEFRLSLCKLTTFTFHQNNTKSQITPPSNNENKTNPNANSLGQKPT